VGYIPAGFDVPWLFSWVIGIVLIYLFHRYVAKSAIISGVKVEEVEKVSV